eukprot:9157520-Pyramimonas_sp.AAC.1
MNNFRNGSAASYTALLQGWGGESTIVTSIECHARPQARNGQRRNHAGVGTPSARSAAGSPMATPQGRRPDASAKSVSASSAHANNR